jgi:hypothetical protein
VGNDGNVANIHFVQKKTRVQKYKELVEKPQNEVRIKGKIKTPARKPRQFFTLKIKKLEVVDKAVSSGRRFLHSATLRSE